MRCLITLAATALVLAACGGGSSSADPDGGAGLPDAETTTSIDAGPSEQADASLAVTFEVRCADGVDNDADGMLDCDDSDCTGHIACDLGACPAGFHRVIVEPTQLPKVIPAQNNLYLYFPGPAGQGMANIEFEISLRHPQAGSLQIEYTHPWGTLPLTYGYGQDGADFDHTIVADDGRDWFEGSPPFRDRFHPPDYPIELLRDYAVPPGGTWQFHIANPQDGVGVLDAFAVSFCVCSDCEVGPACTDGADNNQDGTRDCADDTCQDDRHCVPEIQCNDDEESFANPIGWQVDQDLDDLIDCRDPDCSGHDSCEFGHELTCDDGRDNDADGFDHFSNGPTDCRDPDCVGTAACQVESSCTDGADNDGDGKIDCADVGCKATKVCGGGEVFCANGVDDDKDGLSDCQDHDCDGRLGCITVTCPTGDTLVVVESDRVPVVYGEENWELVQLYVPTFGRIDKVLAELTAGPSYVYAQLDSPGLFPGFAGPLLSHSDGPFDHVVFDDSAAEAATAPGPLTGRYRSAGDPLSALNNLQAKGVWSMQVSQLFGGGAGHADQVAKNVAIAVCVCTTCPMPEVCNDGYDNDADLAVDCQDSQCANFAGCQ